MNRWPNLRNPDLSDIQDLEFDLYSELCYTIAMKRSRFNILLCSTFIGLIACVAPASDDDNNDNGSSGSSGTSGNGTDNCAPAITPAGPFTLTVGKAFTFTPNASDPEAGDTLSFSIDTSDTAGLPDPSAQSPGLSVDATSGEITWTPPAGSAGSYGFKFIATDDGSPIMSASIEIEITVVNNQAPSLNVASPFGITAGSGAATFTATATDPDGDQLTLSASIPGGETDIFLEGATFNTETGIFSWAPEAPADLGTYLLDITVTDDGTPVESDTKQVTINVVENQAPVFSPIDDITEDVGTTITFTVSASDPEGDTFALEASGAMFDGAPPTQATFDAGTGAFSWSPLEADAGTYTATFGALDEGTPVAESMLEVEITVTVPVSATGRVVFDEIYVGAPDQYFILKNIDDKAVNIGGWRTCGANFDYSGGAFPADTILQAGESYAVRWNGSGTTYNSGADDFDLLLNARAFGAGQNSMAIYEPTGSFSSAQIYDFAQWTETNQARANLAVTQDYVPAAATCAVSSASEKVWPSVSESAATSSCTAGNNIVKFKGDDCLTGEDRFEACF